MEANVCGPLTITAIYVYSSDYIFHPKPWTSTVSYFKNFPLERLDMAKGIFIQSATRALV